MQIQELIHILGKRVKVKDKKGEEHFGILQFVGESEFFPSLGLVCTISRQPHIQINSIIDIVLLEEE